MTPRQQVILFAKQHQMSIAPVGADKVVMLSKKHPAGAMWIECFDDWKAAHTWLCSINQDLPSRPWHTPNIK